jgi:hypothetical protein
VPFAYYARLSAARQRIYRRSDALEAVPLPADFDGGAAVAAIRAALAADARKAVEIHCQALTDVLMRGWKLPPIRIRLLARRPSDDYGELHGLYEPEDGATRARITLWMRTAQRQQVVAFKSLLRTLVHEWGHHLDYELFALPESFHTEGFYKRESALANALFAQEAGASTLR